jgi:hypothetical protein
LTTKTTPVPYLLHRLGLTTETTPVPFCTDPSCCHPSGYHDADLSTVCPGCAAVEKEVGYLRTDGTVPEAPEVICIECWRVYDPTTNYRRDR